MYFNFLQQFFSEFDYPTEAQEALLHDYKKIENSPLLCTRFNATVDAYKQSMACDFDALLCVIKDISVQASIHEYTA